MKLLSKSVNAQISGHSNQKNRWLVVIWLSALVFVLSLSTLSQVSQAGGGHDHHSNHKEPEAPKGPQGGHLLKGHGLSLEIKLQEQNGLAEMRVYAYRETQHSDSAAHKDAHQNTHQGDGHEKHLFDNKSQINPADFQINLSLKRLGSEPSSLDFEMEQGYWVSRQSIAEPHSFDVRVEAQHQGKTYQWCYENHEFRSHISERFQQRLGIETAQAQSQTLNLSEELFGVISAPANQVYRLSAPYAGLVERISVEVGARVKSGQPLVQLLNSQTLQSYHLRSPIDGEITARLLNAGESVSNQPILEVADLSQVWVDLSAFPESIEKLKVGQSLEVYDLHQHAIARGKIHYIAPQMTGGHIARARATIANPQGHWRPGMHVKARIQISQKPVALAVQRKALQSLLDQPVVFAKYGELFEPRMLKLGVQDKQYVEVLEGLTPGTEYVTENSFLIKADALKSGASHDH